MPSERDPGFSPHTLADNFSVALANTGLVAAVKKASEHAAGARTATVSTMPDYEELRDRARSIKEFSIENLDALIEKFSGSFTSQGGNFHFADSAGSAKEIIGEIMSRRGVKLVIKSKSMVTEELRLNGFLEGIGIEAVETDLGEFIVQLFGEPPSHIIAPALHRTRQEIGRLFADKLGVEYTDDPGRLTKTARKILREKFLAADCGVSGANFLLAEQGAAVVFENEGNARIVRTLPGTVIFITGMEKIIPSVCDLYPFVRLLPASATGQKSTSYLSVVTARSIVESGRTIHMVLIDCGRSRIRANPDFRESLYCIRCGACLNSCPVYKSTGGHAYGAVYQGPIGSVISPLLCGGMKVKHPFASTLCAACGEVCPVKIEIHAMLLKLRHVSGKGMFERALAALAFFFLKNRASYFFGTILLRLFYGVLKIFKARRVLNLFPRPSKKTFREIYGDGNGV